MACYRSVQTELNQYQREREVTLMVPTTIKQKQQFVSATDATCPFNHLKIKCVSCIAYTHHPQLRDVFSLEKLDIVLDGGALEIDCVSSINSIECLASTYWIQQPIERCLKRCGLTLHQEAVIENSFRQSSVKYKASRAAVSTPLSHLLKRPMPHGNLKRLSIALEWNTDQPHTLLDVLEDPPEVMYAYLYSAFSQLLSSKLALDYPLIFSPEYCKRLEEAAGHIPIMARSIQRVIERASEVSACADTPSAIAVANLHAVACKTKAMRPNGYTDHDIYTQLVIGFYYSTRQSLLSQKSYKISDTDTGTGPAHVNSYESVFYT